MEVLFIEVWRCVSESLTLDHTKWLWTWCSVVRLCDGWAQFYPSNHWSALPKKWDQWYSSLTHFCRHTSSPSGGPARLTVLLMPLDPSSRFVVAVNVSPPRSGATETLACPMSLCSSSASTVPYRMTSSHQLAYLDASMWYHCIGEKDVGGVWTLVAPSVQVTLPLDTERTASPLASSTPPELSGLK